jgi:hypothetical protein
MSRQGLVGENVLGARRLAHWLLSRYRSLVLLARRDLVIWKRAALIWLIDNSIRGTENWQSEARFDIARKSIISKTNGKVASCQA